MSDLGKEKDIEQPLKISEILADFFLKKIDMPSYASDDSDHLHKSKRKKTKHKKRKHKKYKHRNRTSSSDSASEFNIKGVDDVSSSEEMGIKRLKKIKSIKVQSVHSLVLKPTTSVSEQSELKNMNTQSKSSNEKPVFYGPSLELLLTGVDSKLDVDSNPYSATKDLSCDNSNISKKEIKSDSKETKASTNETSNESNVKEVEDTKSCSVSKKCVGIHSNTKDNCSNDNEVGSTHIVTEVVRDVKSTLEDTSKSYIKKRKFQPVMDVELSETNINILDKVKNDSKIETSFQELKICVSDNNLKSIALEKDVVNHVKGKQSENHTIASISETNPVLSDSKCMKSDNSKPVSTIIEADQKESKKDSANSPVNNEKSKSDTNHKKDKNSNSTTKIKKSTTSKRKHSKSRSKSPSPSNHKSSKSRQKSHRSRSSSRGSHVKNKKQQRSRSRSHDQARHYHDHKKRSRSRSYSRSRSQSRYQRSRRRSRSVSLRRRYNHRHSRSRSYVRSKESSRLSRHRRSKSKEHHHSSSKYRDRSRSRRRSRSRSRKQSRSRSRKRSRSRSRKRSRSRSRKRSRSRSRKSKSRSKSKHKSVSPKKSHSRSKSKEKKSSSEKSKKIDQAKILETARRNVLQMIKKGTLPEGLPIENLKKEQLVTIQAGGKSVQELTDFCQRLSQKENEPDVSDNEEKDDKADDETGFIHHPFKVKEPGIIKLNIKNAVQLPIKTHAQKVAETARLSSQFPVSSGNKHRQKELEWIPVVPETSKTVTKPTATSVSTVAETSTAVVPIAIENSVSSVPPPPPPPPPEQPPPPPPPSVPIAYPCPPCTEIVPVATATCMSSMPPSTVPMSFVPQPPLMPNVVQPTTVYQNFPPMVPSYEAPNQQMMSFSTGPAPSSSVFKPPKKLDISSIVAKRFQALQKLNENPNDPDALRVLQEAQENIQDWVESQQVPGLFTGSTDVKVLTADELCGPFKYRNKKDVLMHAPPVTEGKGMSLLKKMGWNPGEGLGKNKEGSLEPLLLDIKMDKKGLVSEGENSKKGVSSFIKDLQGKHPVSALMELCSKRKWKPPLYTCVKDDGPPHKKLFVFKVEVNGVEYQPVNPCSNKKIAKADAAVLCLQSLNVLPKAT